MITFAPLPPMQELQSHWLALSDQSRHPFFLSWHWIGTWLKCAPSLRPMFLSVTSGTSPIAAAIVAKSTVWRRRIWPVRTWSLNGTGQSEFDCIGMEYNGLLAARGHEQAAWRETLTFLLNSDPDWDEIALSGVPMDLVSAWTDRALPIREARKDPSRFLELEGVRAQPDRSCIGLLPSRARTRIRHTESSLGKRLGPITLSMARTADEALVYLDELRSLHDAKWRSHPSRGAFSRPFARRFHREMVTSQFGHGVIQLIRVCAGKATLGVLYNFVYQGHVYFYQSGLAYSLTAAHESPGLMIHAMVIDHNASIGHDVYDMLAGDSQYKRTLTSGSEELWWGSLQRPRLRLALEHSVEEQYRDIKRSFRKN